ncbi:hypothetical protein FM107_02120 [Sphingobacterium sp. JB170]|nr:hypothetical protein FM107_02120 [Sphingobacterium sp. JB170]
MHSGKAGWKLLIHHKASPALSAWERLSHPKDLIKTVTAQS